MNNVIQFGSYLQQKKHNEKSERFVHITPSEVGAKLLSQGFELVSLKEGIARKADRAGHQTTLARYRYSQSALSNDLGGLHYEILVKIPHLYGAIELYSGIFRVVCSNGLVLGAQFDGKRIVHLGDALTQVEETVDSMVASKAMTLRTVESMKQVNPDSDVTRGFIRAAIELRAPKLKEVNDSVLEYVGKSRRQADADNDAWSIYNRVQEFLTRGTVPYIQEVDGKLVRASTRRLPKALSQVSVDFNRNLFDLALNTFEVKNV